MASVRQILSRTFFWSYERGTWQYDVAVILILVFVLLTPRIWFHDGPQVGVTGTPELVQVVPAAGADDPAVYQVDARAVAPPDQTTLLENQLHNVLQKSVVELNSGRFAIAKIVPLRDAQGAVIAYRVELRK
ncbi:MAG TPA: hypothetical protein VJP87_00780 [Candidatus Acidoferrales bacterium]|nr:hypothetical protein [Candidatus Acidoferrales bacterium]